MGNIQWERLLVPQADGYDARTLKRLMRKRFGEPKIEKKTSALIETLPADIAGDFESVKDHENMPAIFEGMRFWPEGYRGFQLFMDILFPLEQTPYSRPAPKGCSSGHMVQKDGSITAYVTCGDVEGAVGGWWHEYGHLRLISLGIDIEDYTMQFFTNPKDIHYVSPIRKDKLRPISACMHGLYAWCMLSAGHIMLPVENVRCFLEKNVIKIEEGLLTLKTYGTYTPEGSLLMTAFFEWADELVERIWSAIGHEDEDRNRKEYMQWKLEQPVFHDPLFKRRIENDS